MTGKNFGWHKRWAIDPSTGHLHHESGVIVALRPATGAPGAVRAVLQPCESALRALSEKHGAHNTPQRLERLLREAEQVRNPRQLQPAGDAAPAVAVPPVPLAAADIQAAADAPAKRGGKREGAGRRSLDGVKGERKSLTLDADTLAVFAQLGGGELSAGAREAARRLVALGAAGQAAPPPVVGGGDVAGCPVVVSGDEPPMKKPRRGAGA